MIASWDTDKIAVAKSSLSSSSVRYGPWWRLNGAWISSEGSICCISVSRIGSRGLALIGGEDSSIVVVKRSPLLGDANQLENYLMGMAEAYNITSDSREPANPRLCKPPLNSTIFLTASL